MFLFHPVVIGHSQYHSTDTVNTSLGRILQKISCVPWRSAILGLDRSIQPESDFYFENDFKKQKSSTTERQSWFFAKMLQSLFKKVTNMTPNA